VCLFVSCNHILSPAASPELCTAGVCGPQAWECTHCACYLVLEEDEGISLWLEGCAGCRPVSAHWLISQGRTHLSGLTSGGCSSLLPLPHTSPSLGGHFLEAAFTEAILWASFSGYSRLPGGTLYFSHCLSALQAVCGRLHHFSSLHILCLGVLTRKEEEAPFVTSSAYRLAGSAYSSCVVHCYPLQCSARLSPASLHFLRLTHQTCLELTGLHCTCRR
jgi:hypothetical protein